MNMVKDWSLSKSSRFMKKKKGLYFKAYTDLLFLSLNIRATEFYHIYVVKG